MKLILVTFFFSITLLNADYLYVKNSSCVYDLEPNQGNSGFCFTYTATGKSRCDKGSELSDFVDGYTNDGKRCNLKNNLKISGMSQDQWNMSMVLLAHSLGFTQLFLINFLVILIARR